MNPLKKIKEAQEFHRLMTIWIGEGSVPVSKKLANKRANICADCDHNDDLPMEQFLKEPVAKGMRRLIALKNNIADMKLEREDELHTCNVCFCILKLLPWVPESVLKNSAPPNKNYPAHCWKKDMVK